MTKATTLYVALLLTLYMPLLAVGPPTPMPAASSPEEIANKYNRDISDIYRRLTGLDDQLQVVIVEKVKIIETRIDNPDMQSGKLGGAEITPEGFHLDGIDVSGRGILETDDFDPDNHIGWRLDKTTATFYNVLAWGRIVATTGTITNYLTVGDITLDGKNSAIYAQQFEQDKKYFYLSPEVFEHSNVKISGDLSATTFSYQETSGVGGELVISNATTLAVELSTQTVFNLTSNGSTLVYNGLTLQSHTEAELNKLRVNSNVFQSSNTIVLIKTSVDNQIITEYMRTVDTGTLVTGISTHTIPSGQYHEYSVTRNADGSGSNTVPAGKSVVSTGRYDPISGESSGYILNDASGANSPYVAVLTRGSTVYNDVTVKFQAGNLGNLTSTEFGSLAGKYGTYVKGDGYFTGDIYGSTVTGSVVQTSSYTDVNKVVIDASGIELTSNVEQLGVASRKILDFNTKGKVELDGKYLTIDFSSYSYRYTQNTWHSDFIEHQYSVTEPLHRMGMMYSSSGVSSTTVIGTVFIPSASKLVALNIAGYKTPGSTITLDVSNFGVSFSTSRLDESDYNLKMNIKLLGSDEVTPVSGYFTYHIDLSTMPFGPGYTDLWNLDDGDDSDNDPAGIGQTVVFKVTLIPESDKYDCRFQYIGSMIEIERINNALYYP